MKNFLIFTATFLFAFSSYGQEVKTTKEILKAATAKAGKENKKVFIIFSASWCGWCKKMDASINDTTTKKYFDENYIILYLTVLETPANKMLETPGAFDYMKSLKADAAGLPFFVILNKNGELVGDSFVNKQNMGCPAATEEIASFITLLKKTSTINEIGLDAIAKRFKLNSPQR